MISSEWFRWYNVVNIIGQRNGHSGESLGPLEGRARVCLLGAVFDLTTIFWTSLIWDWSDVRCPMSCAFEFLSIYGRSLISCTKAGAILFMGISGNVNGPSLSAAVQ